MKIRVINLKNISSYFSKILILIVIVVVFGKFFYNNRNVNASLKVNSSNFLNIMNTEISLFNNSNDENENNLSLPVYSKITVDSEIGLVKMVANQNHDDLSINIANSNKSNNVNDENNVNDKNKNSNNSENLLESNNGNLESVETLVEPEVRSKYRNIGIKCAR